MVVNEKMKNGLAGFIKNENWQNFSIGISSITQFILFISLSIIALYN